MNSHLLHALAGRFLKQALMLLGLAAAALTPPAQGQASSPLALVGPVITTQPSGVSAAVGETVTLRAGASGLGFLTFQWYFNGVVIEGQTGASLVLPSMTEAQFGLYSLRITDATGTVESEPARVSLAGPELPAWITHPRDVAVAPETPVVLEATTSGQPPFAYQWRLNGNNVPGATNRILQIPSAQSRDGGRYTLVASNPQGTIESRPAFLRITLPMLRLTDLFANRAVLMEPNWAGTTNNIDATFELPSGERRHAGKRGGKSVWLSWLAPGSGRVTVSTSGSTFDTLLAIYTGATLGNLMELASDDDSGGYLTSALTFNAVAGSLYHVVVDGFAGAEGVVVLNWSLAPNAPPVPRIISGPRGDTLLLNANLVLSIEAEGTGLTYQWLFNGNPISDVTDSILSLPNLTPAQAGSYSVRITNDAGQTVESVPALIEVASDTSATSQDKLDDLFADPPAGLPAAHAAGGGGFTSVSPGLPGWRETTNEHAQRSPEDPLIFGEIGGRSLWLRFRATTSGWMRLNTEGSAIPTVLGVYTNRANLQPIAEARPEAPETHCELVFGAYAGEDYLVMIDGMGGARGPIRLGYSMELAVIGPPVLGFVGDHFSIEQIVPPGRYEIVAGDTLGAMTSLWSTNITSGTLRFLDNDTPGRPRRFYRIQGVP